MSHNRKMLILAILVVLCFILAAIVISYRSYGLMTLFLLTGFGLMGLGFKLKSDYQNK